MVENRVGKVNKEYHIRHGMLRSTTPCGDCSVALRLMELFGCCRIAPISVCANVVDFVVVVVVRVFFIATPVEVTMFEFIAVCQRFI